MSGGNSKLVIFGSFTEEETRAFQRLSTNSGQPSLEKIQFGSINFNSTLSSKELEHKSIQTNIPIISKSDLEPGLATKTNGNTENFDEARKPVGSLSNGCTSSCHAITKTSYENGKIIDFPGLKSSTTGLLSKEEDVDRESLEDIGSTKTEISLENCVSVDLLNPVLQKGDFQERDDQKTLNGGGAAVDNLLPRGLINSGNLCFLNASLQALLSCSSFVLLLQKLRTRNISKVGYPTLCAFVDFISEFDMHMHPSLRDNDQSAIEIGKSFSPLMFEDVLKLFSPDLPTNISGRPRQEDAQEFLSFVMNRMHDELLKLEGHLSSAYGGGSSMVSSGEDDGWETVGPNNKSAVTRTQSFVPSELSDIFGGQLRSVVKARGNKPSATVQPFLLLHLDIFPAAVHTIEDALYLFSAPETLEGYKASTGKSTVVSASKSVKIQTVPKILILHLMRFSYGSKGIAKLHKAVHFSSELLLGRELLFSPTLEGRRYELVATISHHGRDPSKGHYTTDARYSKGKWLRYDDASVTSVPIAKVLHDQAYVLFYQLV